jgi:glutamine synthetase
VNETHERAQAFIQQNDIKKIRLVFADQNGLTRGKIIPADYFLKSLNQGIGFAQSIYAMDIEGETIPETGLLWEKGDPDYLAVPDLSTLTLVPWKEHTAQVIVEGRLREGAPFFADPRHILKKILAKLSNAGYTVKVASELEFYLLLADKTTPTTTGTQAYSILGLVAVEKVLEQFERYAEIMGIPVEATLTEYAPGQFEINLRYEEALLMADHTFLFRNMIKETAAQLGYHATFMAKPFAEIAGSSFHLHVSLWKEGKNVFARDVNEVSRQPRAGKRSADILSAGKDACATPLVTDVLLTETQWPEALLHFIGGCQHYLNSAMAFFAPHVNSYKRLKPGSYAPINDSWGVNNRTVSLRVPEAEGSASRLEIRTPGADANPYYVIAAALAIGWLGMEEKLLPKPQVVGNAYELPNSVPRDLFDAVEALQASSKIIELFGKEFIHVYTAIKRAEWRKYLSVITEWERGRYFELL